MKKTTATIFGLCLAGCIAQDKPTPNQTYSISGTVSQAVREGVTMTLDPGGLTAKTNAAGEYAFHEMDSGTYFIVPNLSGYSFEPAQHSVTIAVADVVGVNFVATENEEEPGTKQILALPPAGKLYHGVFPGSTSGAEDDFTQEMLDAYENAVGKKVAWVYLSNNWFTPAERAFPVQMATWIRARGAVPFIRLMLRTSMNAIPEPVYTLQAIIDGQFDSDLVRWGQAAADFGTALLVEYGTEVNGDWFSWNGSHNGAGQTDGFGDEGVADGPERFVAAYRHIVDVIRLQGASNIHWVFHPQCGDWPQQDWNRVENYYPGDDYVDWIGFSQYGALMPTSSVQDFVSRVDECYPRLAALNPNKPMGAIEFGSTAGHPHLSAAQFVTDALGAILEGRWPRLRAFAWWNEKWDNGNVADTNMQVQDDPDLSQAFVDLFEQHHPKLQTEPVLTNR